MDTIQIELTNACHLACSNCTRMCGHIRKPFMLPFEQFKEAIDSLVGFPMIVGFMGGEPLLHPEFERFCEYALTVIPREQLGLWSAFPVGREHLREVICKTFGNIFLNNHTIPITHAPILVGAEEVIADEREMWHRIDQCWLQEGWSASINPKGAFFCEIAAAMAMLFGDDDHQAWKVEPGWWKRIPKDYREQMEKWCPRCGVALKLGGRLSTQNTDDISPKNLERLEGKSRRVAKGEYKLHDCKESECPAEMFQYKDQYFRDRVAKRYGIFLTLTDKQFLEPHLLLEWRKGEERKTLFDQFKEQYGT